MFSDDIHLSHYLKCLCMRHLRALGQPGFYRSGKSISLSESLRTLDVSRSYRRALYIVHFADLPAITPAIPPAPIIPIFILKALLRFSLILSALRF